MNLCFVIPTRNRPDLAITAVRALLAEHATPLTVVVSDNSSTEEGVRQLRELCEAAADPRLLYIRPPQELAMAAHWDWALAQALARTAATHFGVHYDRMIAKRGGVEQLARACARHEETLVRYSCDFTYPRADDRFMAWQPPSTGYDYEVRTAKIVELTARGTLSTIGYTWPILLNCMAPRAIFERIRARFGTICDSATPDAAFGYRFCALADRYVFLDRSLSIMYGYRFSNGQAYLRRNTNVTQDYMQLWGNQPWLDAAPIPGLDLGLNIIFHEYNVVQRVVGFPPLDRDGWLGELARGLAYIEDRQEVAKMRALLEEHGWRDRTVPVPLWRRALRRLKRTLRPPPSDPHFATEAEALAYLSTHEPAPAAHNPMLDVLDPVPR